MAKKKPWYERGVMPGHPEWEPLPKDNKTWWMASHCGPGSLDSSEICECELTKFKCAKKLTRQIKKADGDITDPEKLWCGCSGFWCPKCGRFWAQNACWENYADEHRSSIGEELKAKKGWVYCVCGQRLFHRSAWDV